MCIRDRAHPTQVQHDPPAAGGINELRNAQPRRQCLPCLLYTSTLLVDPLSLQYLVGAVVDYSESLAGAQFVIRNPNAKTTCGCCSSFTV